MTNNQINYARHLEDKRSHLAQETETNRHNVVVETETGRHNRVQEQIGWSNASAAHRQAGAAEQNAASNALNAQANLRNAATNEKNATTKAFEATTGRMDHNVKADQVEETQRHNVVTEVHGWTKLFVDAIPKYVGSLLPMAKAVK